MKLKHAVAGFIIIGFVSLVGLAFTFFIFSSNLPRLITLQDYNPKVVSEVYSRDGHKVGEFYREKRIITPYNEIPKMLVQAFVSAEDSSFFAHKGINFSAILRATFANIRAGHTVQGGSTITQQVAKSLMLTPEKNFTRKIKEAILAYRMEKNLKKEEILYLYLNQIYLGHGAYGVEAAAENYFRKKVSELTLAECAILAGMPQAPSKYSPLTNSIRAKERQLYVLRRMKEEKYIGDDQEKIAAQEPVKVYYREFFEDVAPFYRETVRQILVAKLGEQKVLDEGIKIYTAMDFDKQMAAQKAIEKNLLDVDKRQGYRGPKANLSTPEEIAKFLLKERDSLIAKSSQFKILAVDGKEVPPPPLDLTRTGKAQLPNYITVGQTVNGVVTEVDSKKGLVTVRFAEMRGLIDIDDMTWARKPDPSKKPIEDQVKDPAKVLKIGDTILVKIKSPQFSSKRLLAQIKKVKKGSPKPEMPNFEEYVGLTLEQEPILESALLSFDLKSEEILAMVGGANYEKSEYNRAIQAARQTGSSFKAIIYAAALEKGFSGATTIVDAPVVFDEGEGQMPDKKLTAKDQKPEPKKWKPKNYEGKYSGDVLFRTALARSLNVPTVKILEEIGINWALQFAKRLGIFSPLNPDFSTALGSSGTTMYEMLKAFSIYGRGGKNIHPIIINKVTDASGKEVLLEKVTVDEKFQKELDALKNEFNELFEKLAEAKKSEPTPGPEATPVPKKFDLLSVFKFDDPEQLISPQTAFLITHLLKGTIQDPSGTGGRARSLGRPVAGKTGTTTGYYDAWFTGFTPDLSTSVWVGFDQEKPIGNGETGASAALPIWLEYMTAALETYEPNDFPVPPGIVFANIDADTGQLATAQSKRAVREAFREGHEPGSGNKGDSPAPSEEKDYLKEDLSD